MVSSVSLLGEIRENARSILGILTDEGLVVATGPPFFLHEELLCRLGKKRTEVRGAFRLYDDCRLLKSFVELAGAVEFDDVLMVRIPQYPAVIDRIELDEWIRDLETLEG